MKYTISALALLTLGSALFAEETLVRELPTTVVTGELWESELQKTTASVTVLDQAVLEANGTQHFEDIINAIPNLTWTGGTSRPRYIQIRGIGENSQFEGETPDSSVRFLIDDLDLTGLGSVGNLFDVQQVEVLRGPQAGAFGANAAGGVVQIVTNDPTPYWTGQAEATAGNDDLRSAGVAVGGPLLETEPERLTFRVAVHQLEQNGFKENLALGKDDTNERDEMTARLKLRWLLGQDWQFDGQILYADNDNGYDVFTLTNNRKNTFSDQPGRDEQTTLGGSLRVSFYGFDGSDVTWTSQYSDTDSLYSYDSDWGTGDGAGSTFPSTYTGFLETQRERTVFSEELRLDSKEANGFFDRWTLGAYYQNFYEKSDIDYDESSVAFAYAGTTEIESEYSTETAALFGQVGHDFSENTRFVFGLRYEYHTVDFRSINQLDTLGYANAGISDNSKKDHLFGGRLLIEQELNETHLFYASITRGYKAGGANNATFNTPGDPLTYEKEILWNYEIGLRSQWFDEQLETNLTVFYLDRSEAQLRDSAGAGGFFRYFTSNQGDAEHFGLETDARLYIAENWQARASLGLQEADGNTANAELANAPTYNYSAGIDYRPSEGLFGSIELVGRDSSYESNSHAEKRSAFEVVNVSIGYRFGQWTLSLWGKNLFDKAYEDRVFFFNNTDFGPVRTRYEAPADPRTFGVTAKYTW